MVEATGKFEIGVDIGGTFTDVVCRDGNGDDAARQDPDDAAQSERRREGCDGLHAAANGASSPDEIVRFVHGTTVATNAVIEREGREDRPAHDRGLQGRARDRPPDAAQGLRPRAQARDAGVPGAGRVAQGGARSASTATGEVLVAAGRELGRAARSMSWSPKASRRSRSATSSPSSIRRMSGGRARSSPSAIRSIMVSLSSRGRSCLPRVRAHLRDGVRCLYQAGGRTAISRAWSRIWRRTALRRRCRSCSRAAASAPPPSPGSVRCGSSCRAPRPASSAAWRSAARQGSKI